MTRLSAKSKFFLQRLLVVSNLLLIPSLSRATKTHGRITLGGIGATERFVDAKSGSTKNDFLKLTGRFHFKASEIGESQYQFTTDFADKYDFFNKLNREEFQLDAENIWQTKQVSLAYPNDRGIWFAEFGRFPVLDAGSISCDGLELGIRPSINFSTGIFGGLNPRRHDQAYFTWNPNSKIGGIFLQYQPKNLGWGRNLFLNHSLIQEQVGEEIDRKYLYHNLFFQWDDRSRLLTNVYLDFIPKTYLQSGLISWQQGWSREFSTELGYQAIDVIEYIRRQNIRELLPSSPYSESFMALREQLNKNVLIELSGSNGKRAADGLSKTQIIIGTRFNQIWNKRADIYIKGGQRKNFTSNDNIGMLGIGYFTDNWELNIDETYSVETSFDGATTLHALTSEISAGLQVSKTLFIASSIQNAKDERVNIWSAFLKLGYRFGTQEMPPIRDGAAPRGQL